MNELPKSVRDELARQQQSGSPHPDADLLTAFSEGTATSAERATIEQHLASCRECRDVIFLATPPTEVATPVVAVAPKARTRWFPAWAPWAATAAVLFLATFTFTHSSNAPVRQARLAKDERVVSSTPAPSPAPSLSEDKKKEAAPPPVSGALQTNSKDLPQSDAAKRSDSDMYYYYKEAAPQRDERKQNAVAGSVVAGSVQSRPGSTIPAQKTTAAAAPAGQVYEANRAARNTSLKPGPAAPMQNNQMARNQIQQNQLPQNAVPPSTSQTVEVTAEAAAAPMAKSEDSISTYSAPALAKAKIPAQWRISADGKLERLNAGSWTTALAQPSVKFTVVAVIGPIVWTGGTQGALYRSMDAGSTWQPIQLPGIASGSGPTIVHIEFRDAWNGTVTTADHRSWSTKDRGDTWQQL